MRGSPKKPRTVKVAAVQCSSDLGDVEGNRKKLTGLVEQAAKEGAKIIVLPEASVTGYLSQDLRTNWLLKGRPIEEEGASGAWGTREPQLYIGRRLRDALSILADHWGARGCERAPMRAERVGA